MSGEAMSVGRVAFVLAIALTLGGCVTSSSYSHLVADAHARYEQAVLSGGGAPPSYRTVYRTDAIRPRRSATRLRSPTAASESAREIQAPAGSVRLSVTTPTVGSPDWLREKAEWERRDREMELKIRSICRGC